MLKQPEVAVDIRGLVKVFGRGPKARRGLDELDLQVEFGGVHALLGPNGSGKTTTIRVLLGLVRADAGSVHLLTRRVPQDLDQVIGRVGAIVEQPRFFGGFTARRSLLLLADATGAPPNRVDRVLEEVGLRGRGKDLVKTFSLGMRQRLAIASTLLKDPDLFIFDEPTNGLDPEGIHEVRQTIRRLGEAGRTVLLSSHLLAEVAQVADHVSVIERGRLLASRPVSQMLASAGGGVVVRVGDPAPAARELAARGFIVRGLKPDELLVTGDLVTPRAVNQILAGADIWVDGIGEASLDLEQAYLHLTKGHVA